MVVGMSEIYVARVVWVAILNWNIVLAPVIQEALSF